jgi:FkbM family methyltransferase
MLTGVVSKVFSQADVYESHRNTFGAVRGSVLYTRTLVRPRSAGRRVTVSIPGTDIPITVRLGSSDINVFQDIFISREYGWKFSAKPEVIVDAGGYTGMSAAFFAHQYPEATIVAIEPDAENFALLKLNTSRFPNVHPVHAAVWSESGVISLTDPGYGSWGFQVAAHADHATAVAVGEADPATGLVRAVTFDEIIKEFNLDHIDLLKVDVEGSEKEIFANAEPWISSVGAICIELHDRLKTGCSRSFFTAIADFGVEVRRSQSEDVLVARASSPLVPITA